MHDLNEAIDAWCRRVHPKGRRAEERVAELADHLHCEIEALLAGGFGPAEAFQLATERLGAPTELEAEAAKNRPLHRRLLGAVCALDDRIAERLTPRQASIGVLVVSLAAAGVMLALPLLFGERFAGTETMNAVLAIWFVPYSLLSAAASPKGRCRSRVARLRES